MTPVSHAPTYARTNLAENRGSGGGRLYISYPNFQGKTRGNECRGALRVGVIEANESTEQAGLADCLAAVTREGRGEARIYVLDVTPETAPFPGVDLWIGPYTVLSEEVVTVEP